MIGVFLTALLAAAQQAPEGPQFPLPPGVVRGSNLTIPNEISPAVWPYYFCLLDSRGVQRRGLDGSVQAPMVAVGADCAPQRREATERADRLLRNRSLGNASRRAEYIQTVLARVDRFVADMGNFTPTQPPPMAGNPNDALPSIDIPYQILPAYQVYTSCVGGRFTAHPRANSADHAAVRQAHDDAVAACRDVREAQLATALESLTDYRPYGGNRERARQAARTAFDRFDSDYLIESATTGSVAPIGVVRRPSMLALPNEIAPALMPYLQCMLSDSRQRLMGASTGEAARAAVSRLLTDCRDTRATAEERSRQLLENSNVRASDRERMIREALLSADHMRDDVAEHLDQVNARRERRESQQNASN